MIARLKGKIVEKKDLAVIMDVGGIFYELSVPRSVIDRVDGAADAQGMVSLETYHYLQTTPSSAYPVLIGFLSSLEKDFFLKFISVSGVGPKAAVKALDRSISEIASAIDSGDIELLKKLPGIGQQRAKDIVAKLQGKVGHFGLIPDTKSVPKPEASSVFTQEAMTVLTQLQYTRTEAQEMVRQAFSRNSRISSIEELLNEIYKQRSAKHG